MKATDVDTGSSGAFKSNPLKYSVSGSTFTIAENAGVLKFVSAPDYENDQQRSYTATVTATDGTFSTSQDVTITVVDVNDNAPVFKTTSCSVMENTTGICQVKATDVDTGSSGAFRSNPVTFTVAGNTFNITSAGYLSFNVSQDFETSPNTFTAVVTATDGTNSVSYTHLTLPTTLQV